MTMVLSAAQLLRNLEPAVRPGALVPPTVQPNVPLEAQSFDELLAQASKGKMASGRDVDVSFDAQPPLDSTQLKRLQKAADQAEAAGAKQALMMIDGRNFVLDVENRTLTAELSPRSPMQMVNIDTAIFVTDDDQTHGGVAIAPPSPGVLPPALSRQLANRQS
jgi:hypothetical protein